jgi:hypothetical protein
VYRFTRYADFSFEPAEAVSHIQGPSGAFLGLQSAPRHCLLVTTLQRARRMKRVILSVLVALLFFAFAEAAANFTARLFWPGYAMATPQRTYTLTMLIARLIVGAVAAGGSGWIATSIMCEKHGAGLWSGIALLAISLPWHVHVWLHYPVWYHLVWLGCVMPCTVLGSQLSIRIYGRIDKCRLV